MNECYLAHLGGCEARADGQLDRAHLIPAQRLRIAKVDTQAIWDPRAWVWMCRKHHHQLDNRFLHLTRDQLPLGVEDYAAEHGLWWSLDQDYGVLAV